MISFFFIRFLSFIFYILFIHPFWAAAPKGPMTYEFTHTGNVSFSSFSSSVHPLQSSYPGLEAHILALRPKS